MIIVTQNKESVINGEITDLYITDGTTINANMQMAPDTTYILGIYSTAYQARKVLLDMATHICDGGGQVYQMPPDQVPAPTPEKWISQLSAGLVERAYE